MLRALLLLAVLVASPWPAAAHESRPAFLQIEETAAGGYAVLWKRPARGDRALALAPAWPERCEETAPGRTRFVAGAAVERRALDCGAQGLIGARIGIEGLSSTRTDALVRIAFADGTSQTNLVKPAQPWLEVEGPRPALSVAADYFVLGVEHILLGIDHLLFVLALTLIVRGTALLVKTITAFTVAHSLTLAAATFEVVSAPQAPVEAVIALSILFLAGELARQGRGAPGLTERAPWLVAFGFGLLHGLGFASALAEVGLPQSDIPLALLTFNLGVEAGQLAFVLAVVVFAAAWRFAVAATPGWLAKAPAYGIGALAAFWMIDRVAGFA